MSIKAYFDFITSITGIESKLNMPNRKKAADKNENDCSTNHTQYHNIKGENVLRLSVS